MSINAIFIIYLIVLSIGVILKNGKAFSNQKPLTAILGAIIGLTLGIGIVMIVYAGILCLIVAILNFFGVATIGAWPVGFSWTAVKILVMASSLLTFFFKPRKK